MQRDHWCEGLRARFCCGCQRLTLNIVSSRVPYSSILLEPTKPRRNIRVQNQKKRQPKNCLCKTSRSGIDHPGVSRTSFYTVFQYWATREEKKVAVTTKNLGDQNGSYRRRKTTGESFLFINNTVNSL